jgi:hypothetical protein
MPDELPEAVLIELGRLTWSAIHLEDCTDGICHNVVHANPREDRRQIGTKIKDALKALNQWPDGSEVDQIRDWRARAQLALEKRNAFLHSVPLVLFDEHFRKIGDAVGEMPRGDRAYYLRRMDVDEVQKVRAVLDAAQEGWEETEMFAYELHPK